MNDNEFAEFKIMNLEINVIADSGAWTTHEIQNRSSLLQVIGENATVLQIIKSRKVDARERVVNATDKSIICSARNYRCAKRAQGAEIHAHVPEELRNFSP